MSAPARATLRIRFPSGDAARAVHAAIEPENAGFLAARVEGATLVAEATADSPGSLLHTLDDVLAAVSAAEKMLEPR